MTNDLTVFKQGLAVVDVVMIGIGIGGTVACFNLGRRQLAVTFAAAAIFAALGAWAALTL